MADRRQTALTDEERTGITLAVQSAFTKLKNLYQEIVPIFQGYGFTAPSPGVIARDLSEKIEASIVQHCPSFTKGQGHCDLSRGDHDWEVKICKDSGLTINQSKLIAGENYIVVNYRANSQVTRIFVLWDAQDAFFSARRQNSNARGLSTSIATASIEVLYAASSATRTEKPSQQAATISRDLVTAARYRRGKQLPRELTMAKASLLKKPIRRRKSS